MVLEAHCANYREKSRLEKAEIINATFTKNGHIIHTRHLEIPQQRALPGKHTQEGQTEGQRSRNDHEKGERKETAAKLRRQNHVHAGICPLIFCNLPFWSSSSVPSTQASHRCLLYSVSKPPIMEIHFQV